MDQKWTDLLFYLYLRLILTLFRLDKINRFRHLKESNKVLSKTDVTLKLFKIFLKLFHCTIYPKNWKRKYIFIYPSPNSPKNPHNPRGFCLNTRLRLGLCHLKQYRFKKNFQDSINPQCGYGNSIGSTEHSLLHCFQYFN